MTPFSILYDGWPLIYQTDSPEAQHLMAILSCHLDGVQSLLALPASPPDWLAVEAHTHVLPAANSPPGRLAWEQRTLPGLRQRLGAALLHLTSPNPPLLGPALNVVSPSAFGTNFQGGGFASRLRQAVSQGGMARLRGLFWPDDLPPPRGHRPLYRLPPVVPPGFQPASSPREDVQQTGALDLPEAYVLYHGLSDEKSLRRLLDAWSWVVDPLGEAYPLLALGLGEAGRERLAILATEYSSGESVRSLPMLSPPALGTIYRHSAALFHPLMDPPWGGPVRLALASGIPVVSFESEPMSAMVGPAAYLVTPGDARLLGAALITVLVEEGMAQKLAQEGRQRTAAWSLPAFAIGLAQAYQDILGKIK
jgi:glycosyltransferase involved in cell wall biosynthesis